MDSLEQSPPAQDPIQLPILDVSAFTAENGKRMLEAAIEYGFLYVDPQGTAFTKDIVAQHFELSQNFFASPEEEKQACPVDMMNRGWAGMHKEVLDPKNQRIGDFKEVFNMGEFTTDGHPAQPMPRAFEDHISDLYNFESICRRTCHQILDLLALGLEIEEPLFFSSRHTQPSGSVVRMLYYPAVPEGVDYDPDQDIRAGAHSDYGSITLLFQRAGQPGLQIKTPDDTWAPVAVIPDGYEGTFPPILVNIADLLSYWTNGLLPSTVHRVIFPREARKGGEDRYSIVYFCHPADDTRLVPVPSKIVQAREELEDGVEVGYGGGAATKRAMTAMEHLQNRLNATYGFRMEATEVKTA